MHECDIIIEHLYEYINSRDITPEISLSVKTHLVHCRQCYSKYDFERRLLEKLQSSTVQICPERLRERVKLILEDF